MFTKLHLENFLSFKGPMDIPLRPLNVVVGPNNSGKSNLLTALRFLSVVSTGQPFTDCAGRFNRRLEEMVWRNSVEQRFAFGIVAEDAAHQVVPWKECQYQLELKLTPNPTPSVEKEYFRAVSKTEALVEEQRVGPGQRPCSTCLSHGKLGPLFRQRLASISFFHFNPGALRAAAQVSTKPSLLTDGTQLPAVLDDLKDEHPDVYEQIEDEFRQCVPEIERIQLRKNPNNPNEKFVLLKERGCKDPFGAAEISDGLLLFLALLCCIHTQPKPSMILLEEPEHGVHPRRLKDILELLYSITESKGDEVPVQILLTTHSPYLLDQFKDDLDAVLVLEKGEEGTTVKSAAKVIADIGGLHGRALGDVWYSGVLGGVPK